MQTAVGVRGELVALCIIDKLTIDWIMFAVCVCTFSNN